MLKKQTMKTVNIDFCKEDLLQLQNTVIPTAQRADYKNVNLVDYTIDTNLFETNIPIHKLRFGLIPLRHVPMHVDYTRKSVLIIPLNSDKFIVCTEHAELVLHGEPFILDTAAIHGVTLAPPNCWIVEVEFDLTYDEIERAFTETKFSIKVKK